MFELAGDLGLDAEPLPLVGAVAQHPLQRDRPADDGVFGQPDLAHAPRGVELLQDVAPAERRRRRRAIGGPPADGRVGPSPAWVAMSVASRPKTVRVLVLRPVRRRSDAGGDLRPGEGAGVAGAVAGGDRRSRRPGRGRPSAAAAVDVRHCPRRSPGPGSRPSTATVPSTVVGPVAESGDGAESSATVGADIVGRRPGRPRPSSAIVGLGRLSRRRIGERPSEHETGAMPSSASFNPAVLERPTASGRRGATRPAPGRGAPPGRGRRRGTRRPRTPSAPTPVSTADAGGAGPLASKPSSPWSQRRPRPPAGRPGPRTRRGRSRRPGLSRPSSPFGFAPRPSRRGVDQVVRASRARGGAPAPPASRSGRRHARLNRRRDVLTTWRTAGRREPAGEPGLVGLVGQLLADPGRLALERPRSRSAA